MQNFGRRLAFAIAGLTAIAGLAFFVLYLVRWEWHRALIAGLFMVGAEVALAAGLILRRLGEREEPEQVLAREGRGSMTRAQERRDLDFRWLEDTSSRYGVFVPLLLGGGVLVSGVAWLVERVAKGSTGRHSALPSHYQQIALPEDALVPRDDEVRVRGLPELGDEQLHRLLGPGGAPPR